MKKIYSFILTALLLLGLCDAWAGTSTTVYYAVSSTTLGSRTIKLDVDMNHTGSSYFQEYSMTKTNKTYNGKDVYSCTFTDLYNGVRTLRFNFYNGDTYDSRHTAFSWGEGHPDVSTYNHKVFVEGTSQDGAWYDTYTIYSDWGTGDWAHELIFDGISKTLSASTEYTFKMCKNMTEWWGSKTGIKWYSASNFTLNEDQNCSLYTNFAGTYTFTNSGFSLTVAYPTQTYTAYFEKPSNWSQVKAHIWRYEDSANKNITDWPGQVITTTEGNYYKATFTSPAEPTGIIWNKHDGTDAGIVGTDQTSNLTFEENAIYWFENNGEIIPSFTVTFTPDGYATFHYPTDNVLLPSGVTACSVGYSAPTLPLTDFSGDNSNVIPANLPVILKGSGSATLYATKNTAFASGSSVLTGSGNSGASGGEGIYVLGIQGESTSGTAFYRYPSGTIPANRAYLNTGGKYAPDAIRIVEGENNTTNLESVETANNSVKFIKNGQLYIMRDGVVYDVMGRIAE